MENIIVILDSSQIYTVIDTDYSHDEAVKILKRKLGKGLCNLDRQDMAGNYIAITVTAMRDPKMEVRPFFEYVQIRDLMESK